MHSPTSQRPRRISISKAQGFRPIEASLRSPPISSLQQTATINAGIYSSASSPEGSPLEHRRSSLLNNLLINDPTVPAPGEMQNSNGGSVSPRLVRKSFISGPLSPDITRDQPFSLGELHQEIESEQEAQVNRLLHMIQLQQSQITTMSQQNKAPTSPLSEAPTVMTASSVASNSTSTTASTAPEQACSPTTSPGFPSPQGFFTRPTTLFRQSSWRKSTGALSSSSPARSPGIRPHSLSASLGPLSEDFLLQQGSRDECAFYQAEAQTLTRENQMLKLRIRELERQLSDVTPPATSPIGGGTFNYSPALGSPLANTPKTVTSEMDSAVAAVATATA